MKAGKTTKGKTTLFVRFRHSLDPSEGNHFDLLPFEFRLELLLKSEVLLRFKIHFDPIFILIALLPELLL